MLTTRFVVGVVSVAMVVLGIGGVCGQNYPNKPIRIVASASGGSGDFNARLIAQWLTSALRQPVIVENRGGIPIAAQTVANATPDGYTVLLHGSVIWLLALMQDNLPWDPVRDFLPITLATNSPNILVVHPSVPVKSVKELIALVKAKPGMLNYASSGIGSSPHLAAELFKSMAGINIVHIPYKGIGPAFNDLISGQVQLIFGTAISVAPHIKSGRLRAVAVTSAQPSALLPSLPTIAASGLPGYEAGSRQGIWAPAKTPATIIKQLNQEIVRVLNTVDVKERLLSTGAEATPSSPEQFAATIKSDMTRMGKVIKDAGIRAE